MNLSQLITKLEDYREDYGNLDIFLASDEDGNRINNLYGASLFYDDNVDSELDNPVICLWPGWQDFYDRTG